MINNRLHTPEGFKDYLPCEYGFKSETERRIEDVFVKYGFEPVKSPMLEYMEVFDGAGSINHRHMYKIIDRNGFVLALRADMTPAIARIAATAYEENDIPLRFYYIENAFRYNENYQGKLREFTQAGVELIGIDSAEADAEVIAAAVNSILSTGLNDFRIDIGHIQFFKGVLEEAGFDEDTCCEIQEAIIDKQYTAVEEIVKDRDIPEKIKSFLTSLPFYIGGYDMLKKVKELVSGEKALNAIARLEDIYDILKSYKIEKFVRFDFSVVGLLDYYTGIIFRGYAKGTGFSIIDGGRYDRLIKNYGADYPAVGFGIRINDLISSLSAHNISFDYKKADTLLVYSQKGRNNALMIADELRAKGLRIENSLLGEDLDKNKEYAKRKGMGGILYFYDETNVKLININDGDSEKIMNISQLLNGEA